MRIAVTRGDITERKFDAIVSGTNSWLIPGVGIDGVIHRVGGSSIFEGCKDVLREKYPSGLGMGQAIATTAGNLPARWVIHTVAPIYSQQVDRSEQLIGAYRAALRVADELRAKTIGFPSISTERGYAFPPDLAARLSVEALQYAKTDVEYAEFVLLDITLYEAFVGAMICRPMS